MGVDFLGSHHIAAKAVEDIEILDQDCSGSKMSNNHLLVENPQMQAHLPPISAQVLIKQTGALPYDSSEALLYNQKPYAMPSIKRNMDGGLLDFDIPAKVSIDHA